ncbi:MAG: elongation factor P [Proteobacteria bacterium]|nr:elongation factor P [Pseudomonadota bacterium]
MYSTQDFRKNLKIEIDGEPYVIVECQHVKPGKGVAFVKTKYKSLITGRVLENNFRSGDTIGKPDLEIRNMEYLYKEEDKYVFMDQSNYEQVHIEETFISEAVPFLKDNIEVEVLFHKGKPISIELPTFVVLKVVKSDPGVKGDTAQGGTKPATLETGATILVPLYLEEGEYVRVDTRTGEFVERAKV